MNLTKFSFVLIFAALISACGGGVVSTASLIDKPTENPVQVTVNITGVNQVAENSAVVLSADTNATGSVTFQWEILSDYDITPQTSGNTLTFMAPKLYEETSVIIEVALTVNVSGSSIGTYGYGVVVENQNTFEDKAAVVATASLSSAESYASFAYLARSAINQIEKPLAENSDYCTFKDRIESNYADNDQDNKLSSGDTIIVNYSECWIRKFDITLYGSLMITISELSTNDNSVSGTIMLDNILIEQNFTDDITATGILDFSFSQTTSLRTTQVSNINPIAFRANDQAFVNIANMSFTKTENVLEAKYSISMQGVMSDALSGESYEVSTLVPILGFFGEYAIEGEILLVGTNDEAVRISKENTSESRAVNLLLESALYEYEWDFFSDLSLFSLSTVDGFFPRNYVSTNFDTIGLSEPFLLLETPVNLEFEYFTSRPISSTSEGPYFFQAGSFPFEQREATLEISGAQLKIIIEDSQTLRAGTPFSLFRIDLFSELNQRLGTDFIDFSTSNSVIPIVTTSVLAYREGDLPTLDGSTSILNDGNTLTYEWFERSDLGIVFTEPNAGLTEIVIPMDNNQPLEDIVIGLRVSNDLGNVAQSKATISYLPAPASYFSMTSEMGEYIGQGQLWLLSEPGAIIIQPSPYQENALRILYEVSDTRFELNIKAPNEENLAVGEYLNATRLPFQAPENPGMDFSGDGRGCNSITGSFDILELNYNAEGEIDILAIDFIQFCEMPNGPSLRGEIRVNSNLPIH